MGTSKTASSPATSTATAPPTAAPVAHVLSALGLDRISISKSNPRKHLDEKLLEELTASIRTKGVLQPVLVRPVNGAYELVCGQRRYHAAQAAGLVEIPVIVRELTDVEVLEVQVIENLQRADVHPLEEAEGYRALMSKKHGYTAERIGERIGRPARYVYDRVALLGLSPAARKLFLDGVITVGHAVPLARLSHEDQARAMEIGALLSPERLLFDPHDDGKESREEPVKAVTVREFQAWIDKNVRFPHDKEPDPVLFPETVATLGASAEKAEKVVPITHEHYIPPETRTEGRTWGPRSWKRADGQHGSKGCDHSVVGVVVVGPERGDAFRVCVAKEKCTTHWRNEQKTKAARAKRGGRSELRERASRDDARRKAEQARDDAGRERWEKARPAILAAVAGAVAKATVKPGGLLEKILIDGLTHYGNRRTDFERHVPRGQTVEDLVRHLAFMVLHREVRAYDARLRFPRRAKAFGIDTLKILDAAAPGEPAPAKKAAAKKRRKK